VLSRRGLEALLLDHLERRGDVPVASALSPDAPTELDVAGEFGALLAGLHGALADFVAPPDAAVWRLGRSVLVGSDPAWIERLYGDTADGRSLVGWWEELRPVLRATGGDDVGMCHGEAYPATCRFVAGGSALAVAELSWAGEGCRLYDLATFRWVLELHRPADAPRLFAEFLAGYASVRTPPSLDGLRAWVAARHLWSLRLAAGFADDEALRRRAAFAASWPIQLVLGGSTGPGAR
jgi:Ser/Thr protein kinase RdoA (MazF antagonist)